MIKKYKISPNYQNLFPNPEFNDLQNNGLKGNVKKVISVEIDTKDSNPMAFLPFAPSNTRLYEISEFDSLGILRNYREVYEGNIPYLKMEYIFDSNNLLIKELTLDENNVVGNTVNFKYNSNRQTIEEYREETDILYTGVYDENGILCRVIYESELQAYEGKCFFLTHDNRNNIIEVSELRGQNLFVTKFEFNKNNYLIKIQDFNSKKELTSENTLEYDRNNNIIKSISKDKRRTTIYDYEFEYDKNENWLISTLTMNGNLYNQTKREIEYY